MKEYRYSSAFTLIELSIVLVIIGFIMGGILTGRDLIDAAAQRAQISQIEKYQTAAHAFQLKYGYLPGDIPDPYASNFGFISRGTTAAQENGDGFLQGYDGGLRTTGLQQTAGETVTFWEDLSKANLIDGGFNTANSSFTANVSGTSIGLYLPAAKIGNGNYIYAYNGGYRSGNNWIGDGYNYYGITEITTLFRQIYGNPGLTVQQAYNIDSKVDDGLPQSGNVTVLYLNDNISPDSAVWASGGGVQGANNGVGLPAGPTTAATPGSTTTCYDNNNVAGVQQTYSLSQNAKLQNCTLSFKFQ